MTKPMFTLRVSHPSIDPAVISETLGLPADNMARADEPKITPKGHPLSGRNKQTFWWLTLAGDESGNNDLGAGLRDIANRLEPHQTFLRQIREGGGRIEIFIGWFLDRNEGIELSHELMQKFAALGLDLSFDVYPPQTQQN